MLGLRNDAHFTDSLRCSPTAMGRAFAREKGLGEYEEEFAKGASS